MPFPVSETVELPAREGSAYLTRVYEGGGAFATLHDHFTADGFEFFFERAKVVLFLSGAEGRSHPALIAIAPSYVDVQPADASHRAVGIAALSDGTAVATSVTVEHNPFRITSFTLHVVENDGSIAAVHDLKTDDLARIPLARLRTRTPPDGGDRPFSEVQMNRATAHSIISQTYKEILSDDFARPLYPDEGFASLVGQSPLVAKWAILNASRSTAVLGIKTCGCSCTCCNGCTTTSCEIEF